MLKTGVVRSSADRRNATLTVADVETYNSEQYYYSISYPTEWGSTNLHRIMS
ncbi:hypothetical protein ACFLUU_07200 [Chloroflexota bacterium]